LKTRFLIFFFALTLNSLSAQFSEMGVMVGASYYIGDLNQSHFKNSNLSTGLIYRYSFNPRIAFRVNLLLGKVEAYDSQSKNINQVNRNLSFKSNFTELGAMIEVNYYSYVTGDKKSRFTTYIVTGLSFFKMNPKAQYLDVWYELHPLKTEGEGLANGPGRYKLDSFALPFGLGAKINLVGRLAISLEYSLRFTATDYLDDVSTTYYDNEVIRDQVGNVAAELADRRLNKETVQTGIDGNGTGMQRGDSSRKDWYGFAGVFVTVRLGKKPTTCARWN
jgi:hypothetical protein